TPGGPADHRAAFLRGAHPRRGARLPASYRLAPARADGDAAMRCLLLLALAASCSGVCSQEKSESRELVGQLGSRSVYVVLHSTQRSDTSWRMTGEYLILPTLSRRFLEGERSPERGFTNLRES